MHKPKSVKLKHFTPSH